MKGETRPDLSGTALSPGDWSTDDGQGVDYELIFDDTLQYCFIEMEQDPLELDFMAFGQMGEDKCRYHPEIHTRTVPEEVCEWLNGQTYGHVEYCGVPYRKFTVTGIANTDDGPTVFETEGDIGDREQMTAPDLVRAVVVGEIRVTASDTEKVQR